MKAIRAAWSKKERVEKILAQLAQMKEDGEVPGEMHDLLLREYQTWLEDADLEIRSLQEELTLRKENLCVALKSLRDESACLSTRLKVGALSQSAADRRQATLARRTAGLEEDLKEVDALLAARTAMEAGGVVDVTLPSEPSCRGGDKPVRQDISLREGWVGEALNRALCAQKCLFMGMALLPGALLFGLLAFVCQAIECRGALLLAAGLGWLIFVVSWTIGAVGVARMDREEAWGRESTGSGMAFRFVRRHLRTCLFGPCVIVGLGWGIEAALCLLLLPAKIPIVGEIFLGITPIAFFAVEFGVTALSTLALISLPALISEEEGGVLSSLRALAFHLRQSGLRGVALQCRALVAFAVILAVLGITACWAGLSVAAMEKAVAGDKATAVAQSAMPFAAVWHRPSGQEQAHPQWRTLLSGVLASMSWMACRAGVMTLPLVFLALAQRRIYEAGLTGPSEG